jgi:hypothetical protein
MKNSKIKLTTNSLSDTSNFLLYNTANYKPVINDSVSEIVLKLIEAIVEYMRFITNKITIKNNAYWRYIFERGVNTIIHVFSIIFFCTKNLELTFYHTQKAFYFYIEFIEQISDDSVTFLQLSSRDATLFVYKKTIFDLNNGYKKNMPELTAEETGIMNKVNLYTSIYKSLVLFVIKHVDVKYDKHAYINTCCENIEQLNVMFKPNIMSNYMECIHIFITLLVDKNINVHDLFHLLTEFVKKIANKKYNEDPKVIENRLYNIEISNFIDNDNFIDWVLAH